MVHVLDALQLGRQGIIAATAVEIDNGIVLFDTGPESTFANIAEQLQAKGFAAKNVRHVFLSHIHFDHAGAAFRFADLGATVYVHPRGAPHLLDPTRLVESATRIFGDRMKTLWGEVRPVPERQLRVLKDGDRVDLGSVEVQAIETTGHASHHHVYYWDETVFGGDVAGVRIGDGPPIPPFVPPELHIESWLDSLTRIRALNPANIYLPHFGPVPGSTADHLDQVAERVRRWSDWFKERIGAGVTEKELVSEFSEYEHRDLLAGGAGAEGVIDYEAADPSFMAVPAAIRYWSKYHGVRLQLAG